MVEMVFPRVLALQVLEKTLRLERLLGLPRISQGAIDAEAVLAFRDQLKTIRRNLRLAARKLGPYGKELTPQVQQSVVRILNQCFNQIDYLHSHLSYVTSQLDIPETRAFVSGLLSRFGDSQHEHFTLIFSDTYMFEETDLVSYLEGEISRSLQRKALPALFLPKVEAENPLQWASLVHEFVHAKPRPVTQLLPEREIERIVGRAPGAREILENWATELYCDAYSLRLLGPAYLAAFIEFVILVGPQGLLEN